MELEVNIILRSLRENKSLTLTDVAEEIGISEAHLGDIENCPDDYLNTISLRQFRTLAVQLGTTIRELVCSDPSVKDQLLDQSDIARALSLKMKETELDIERTSEIVGWECDSVLDLASGAFYQKFCLDGLIDLCDYLELDWTDAVSKVE